MNEKQMKSFVKVEYNLLATSKLSSTQKLFVSYIIGWQKNKKICFETNKTLASKFGMQYGGIRSVITTLNKFDFFKAIKKDYDERTGTSGHEITVSIEKLETFLGSENSINGNYPTKVESNQAISNDETNNYFIEEGTAVLKVNKNFETEFDKYRLDDIIYISEILPQLGYIESQDVRDFIEKGGSSFMLFKDFISLAKELFNQNDSNNYKGFIVTDEVLANIQQMIQD
jgi:hypothetical protein